MYTHGCQAPMIEKAQPIEEQTERLQMRVSKSFLRVVDDWRRKQADLPSRAEAIRRLVERGRQR
jgi:hypothetical protein